MNVFMTELTKDIALTKQVEELYGYGPLQEKTKRGKYAEYRFKLVENDDYKQCDNIILKVFLYRGPVEKGKQSKPLFHISLHPKLPKYVRDRLRSRSGCGFFEKHPGEAANEAEEENSPFGYTIESLDWDGPVLDSTNPNSPWLPLLVDPRDPGSFRRNLDRFEILFKEGFTDGRKASSPLPDLELVNRVHKGLYNKFIDTWNSKWLPGIPGRSSAAGEVLEEALPSLRRPVAPDAAVAPPGAKGGTRKRRHRRYKKTRRIKKSVAHKH